MIPLNLSEFVFTADWHCGSFRNGPDVEGVNGRLLDIRRAIALIVDYAQKNQLPLIMCGDTFKDKHPSMLEMKVFAEVLSYLIANKVEAYFLLGNHDVSRLKGQAHALAPFMPLITDSSVHIIDKPTVIHCKIPLGNDCDAYFFPYMSSPQEEALKEFTKDATKNDILFLHGTVAGGSMNKLIDYEIFDEDAISMATVSKFRQVFAGHLHDYQSFGNVLYAGSIERLDFGDEKSDKCYHRVDLKSPTIQIKVMSTQARYMLTLAYAQLEEVRSGRIDVRNAIVRVTGVDKDYVQDARKLLTDKGCYFIAGLHTSDQIINEIPKTTSINIAEFVKKYAEKVGYKGDVENASKIILETVENL